MPGLETTRKLPVNRDGEDRGPWGLQAARLLSARSGALSSCPPSPGAQRRAPGAQRRAPWPLGAAPAPSRGAVPRGLRSRPGPGPAPRGGSAHARRCGRQSGRRRPGDPRGMEAPAPAEAAGCEELGGCFAGARPGPGTRGASLAFAVQGAGLRGGGGIRAPGVSRVRRGRPCARTSSGWRGGGVCRHPGQRLVGGGVFRHPGQRLVGPGTPAGVSSSRASASRWSLGPAWPRRALRRVCRRQSAGVSVCLSLRPPVQCGESPGLSTSKGGGGLCHGFFPGCLKEVAIVFFAKPGSQHWASPGEASFDSLLPQLF